MRLKLKDLAGEVPVSLFLSLGIHTAIITAVVLYKILWPEFGKSSSVEVELLKSKVAEERLSVPKVLSAVSSIQREDGAVGEEPLAMEPPIAKNAEEGTGNIQSNEPEGAGSGNVPLPSTKGEDALKTAESEEDKRGLGNTEFSLGNGNAEGTGKGVFVATGFGGYPSGSGGGIGNLPRLPFVPRQVLEVVPEKPSDERAEGEIDLILRIGTDGFVKEHRVNSNTTNSYRYLNNVIKAAYKSKWEAVTYKGDKVEYWIEKKYSFN